MYKGFNVASRNLSKVIDCTDYQILKQFLSLYGRQITHFYHPRISFQRCVSGVTSTSHQARWVPIDDTKKAYLKIKIDKEFLFKLKNRLFTF